MNVEKIPVGFLGTNCYIVHDGKVAVIIDPGEDAEKILSKIHELGVFVEYVFLTHAHFDHVLGVDEIVRKTGAKLVAGTGERERMKNAELSGLAMIGLSEFTPLTADVETDDGYEIDVGEMHFKFLLTPGHTEGSVCIICENLMFSGDTLFAGTCGRCDLPGGDYAEILTSLKKLYDLPGDYRVFPGHEAETTLSHERVYNPFMTEAIKH